jgi:hypothetical protein
MANEHGSCPECGTDLNGGLIWQEFYHKFVTEGDWLDRNGDYTSTPCLLETAEAELRADSVAANYGATRTSGRWGRAIALYDLDLDRTVSFRCPDCDHEWPRISITLT